MTIAAGGQPAAQDAAKKDEKGQQAIDVQTAEKKEDINPEFDPHIQYRDYQLLCWSVTAWTFFYLCIGSAFIAYYTWPRTVAAVNSQKFKEPSCSEPLAMFDLAMGASTFLLAITPLIVWALMRLCKLYKSLYVLLVVVVLNVGLAAYGTYLVFSHSLWTRVHKGMSAATACDLDLYNKTSYTLFVYWAVTLGIILAAIIFAASYGMPTAIKESFDLSPYWQCIAAAVRKSNAAIAARCKASNAWCRKRCTCCGKKGERDHDSDAEEGEPMLQQQQPQQQAPSKKA